ncbi:uncharacterized protein BYT42DRAFT_629798 [Radiomyces spectabilis]|uniref:uncharacterized protein n=1 Tax=Radiomyces spectabilis TaxID=64574 RepID=UPI00221F6116|nr:uncharacterized protein BYT42DRAFT_629798 [Radiomyces spectabilis]KAI8391789.1 hypothetical protein BYT42DRAFT_629798 [Radiomyces spectabilis]
MKIKLISLLYSIVIAACVIDIASARTWNWNFSNWNKYKKDPSTKSAKWLEAWGMKNGKGWSWPSLSGSQKNHAIVKDPAAGGSDYVLRVVYPNGSSNPGSQPQGGIGFSAEPVKLTEAVKTVQLEYKVFFPKNFKFVKGGKLPGLYGGQQHCSGGNDAINCFSSRFMWRSNGMGEVYAYLPDTDQRDGLCDVKNNVCNPKYGYSLGRGAWTFKTGRWTTVVQKLVMNTPGKPNGRVTVYVNGRKVYEDKKIACTKTKVTIYLVFHSFFGGNGKSWATPAKQYTYFKGFVLTAYDH